MKGEKVMYNGQVLDAEGSVIYANNRGFLYGDGLFETIRVVNGKPCFLDNHFNRLKMGMKALKISIPETFDLDQFANEIRSLLELNHITAGGRCRLTVTRRGEGFYQPKNVQGFDYMIQADPLSQNYFELNEEGLDIDIYTERVKQVTPTSNYKTLNSELYVMASMFAQETKMDAVLLRNDQDAIIESTNSNLFIVSNSVLYTVPLADGCVGGTMRMHIINIALANNYRVYETSFKPRNLLVADEVFLTNAITGIRWVKNYRQKNYSKEITPRLMELLNESI